MLDLRPNIQIPPDAMRPQENPYAQILPALIQGQEAGRANRTRQMVRGLLSDPKLQEDPTIGPILPFLQAQPDMLPQVLPTLIAARAKAMKGGTGRTVYVKQDGSWSQTPVEGSTPITVTDSQYGTGFQRQSLFEQGVNLQKGKETGRVIAKLRSEAAEATRAKTYINDMYADYIRLQPKYGGALRGPAAGAVSAVTGGYGKGKVPYSDPKVASFNKKANLGIANLKIVANLKERLTDRDMAAVIEQGKFSLGEAPEAVAEKKRFMDGILDAIISQDDNALEAQLAPLGIHVRPEWKMKRMLEEQMQQIERSRTTNNPIIPQMPDENLSDPAAAGEE